jgi:hypothetical protein
VCACVGISITTMMLFLLSSGSHLVLVFRKTKKLHCIWFPAQRTVAAAHRFCYREHDDGRRGNQMSGLPVVSP